MDIGTFIHSDGGAPNTLSEIKRLNELVGPGDFIGLYAYATQSGVASFELEMGSDFWQHTPSRWLFGLDYGRTQPQAIRSIAGKDNTEVRIVDGAWIVNQEGFLSRRDYHPKVSILLNILMLGLGWWWDLEISRRTGFARASRQELFFIRKTKANIHETSRQF